MALSIIILNYKNPALLRLCLKSTIKSLDSKTKYEIIVVDSASSIETRNVVIDEFKNIKLIPFKENVGYTRGNNAGIKESCGDYILLLNPDIILLNNCAEEMMNFLEQNKNVGLIGPQLLNFDGTCQDSCFRFITIPIVFLRRSFWGKLPFAKKTLDHFLMRDKDLSKNQEVDWLMGSAAMVSRNALNRVGIMNEKFFHYMSDVDWARRFWENGYKVVYYPEVKMYHYHQRSSKGGMLNLLFKKEARWHLKDAIKYFSK